MISYEIESMPEGFMATATRLSTRRGKIYYWELPVRFNLSQAMEDRFRLRDHVKRVKPDFEVKYKPLFTKNGS